MRIQRLFTNVLQITSLRIRSRGLYFFDVCALKKRRPSYLLTLALVPKAGLVGTGSGDDVLVTTTMRGQEIGVKVAASFGPLKKTWCRMKPLQFWGGVFEGKLLFARCADWFQDLKTVLPFATGKVDTLETLRLKLSAHLQALSSQCDFQPTKNKPGIHHFHHFPPFLRFHHLMYLCGSTRWPRRP